MRRAAHWSILSLLCFFGIQQGQAQPAACLADDLCTVGEAATVPEMVGQSPPLTNVGNLLNSERCPEAPVVVAAETADERRLGCSAAAEAIRRLAVCGIAPRKPVRFQIMSEVRHPFSGAIFGLFDTKQERVLVTQEANVPTLVEGTPYAALPQRDFYRSLIIHEAFMQSCIKT
jgi:hypothetical protein|nr:MAG: hypothetical protein DIU57_01280 [Pseudomonadota bacterium]